MGAKLDWRGGFGRIVAMWPCDRRDTHQKWKYDSGEIKAADGSCLFWGLAKVPHDAYRAATYPCDSINGGVQEKYAKTKHLWRMSITRNFKKSERNPLRFRSDYKIQILDQLGHCLEGEKNKQGGLVEMSKCDLKNRNQQWHFKVLPDSLPMCRNMCYA